MTAGRTIRGCRTRAASVVSLALVSACGYPTFGFVPGDSSDADLPDTALDDTTQPLDTSTDASSEVIDAAHDLGTDTRTDADDGMDARDARDAKDDATPCPLVATGDACAKIPRFGTATQVVDGVGDEFCGIPATKLVATAGAHMDPTPPPSGIDTVMWTRIAWSTTAVHIHVRVDQAMVYPPLSTEELYRGDGIELFISGSSTLTGDYTSAKEPGTFQLIAVAPQAGTPARAGVYYGSDGLQTFLDPSHYAARITPTGYELEFKIDWVDLKATPTSGKIIGFDAAVDVRQTAASTLKLQSFIGFRPVTVASPCGLPRGPHPSCDDRTWCLSTLE